MTDISTRILHADRLGNPEHGATHKPLHVATGYGYETADELCAVFQGDKSGYVYGRQGNPTTAALEAKITMMEGAAGTVSFATGMGAICSTMIALLRAGDHVVASRFLFGNTASFFKTLELLGCSVSLVDATDAANVAAALTPQTRMVFVETVANPRTQVADLAGIGKLCAERGVVYFVDNTLTTPALFQPKSVQASLIVHSLSKGICGHGNALGGSVTDTGIFDWTKYPNIQDAYKKNAPTGWGLLQIRKKGLRDIGATLSSEHAHRIAVGAETMALRVERASSNSLALAQWLEKHPKIAKVYYPGLASHAEHERAKTLFEANGALMSFEPADGIDPSKLLNELKLVIKSSHLGDNRTLALPAARTIFFEMGAAQRESMGIAESLIRVSVGIEAIADLQADFEQGLAKL
ncbi:cystathionine gamma-synthase family protein [Ramlibacter sp.]|uniref:cystathionine gamma-synthase family protein n=1 Tax=Ramlibacter sp. TaxID=1917967 RepID=UPI003D12EA2F